MLAIIVPYYKIKFLQATLESIANQTNKNFKVYIFNDNSPSSPDDLLNNYKNRFDFVYHKFDENLGSQSLVAHWHRCLDNIQEEWFTILGDDDCLPNNYIASFQDNLENIIANKIQVIRYATIIIDDNNNQVSKLFAHPIIENSINSLIRKLQGNTRSSLSEFIYKNCLDRNKYFIDFPNAFYSDDLSVLLASNFQNIFTINDAIVQVRRGNFNLSGQNSSVDKANRAEFLFIKYLLFYYNDKFDLTQKKLFLHKLNRLTIRTKSLYVYWFVLKNQIHIKDFLGMFYLPKLAIKKIFKH